MGNKNAKVVIYISQVVPEQLYETRLKKFGMAYKKGITDTSITKGQQQLHEVLNINTVQNLFKIEQF
jgi:hypothetical protein